MIKELKDTLLGNKPENDIFTVSYRYAERDYESLTAFINNRYDREAIFSCLRKERKRLQRLKYLKGVVICSDGKFNLGNEERLRKKEIIMAEKRLFRFAMMRDQGTAANPNVTFNNFKDWIELLLTKDKVEIYNLLNSPEEFTKTAKRICKAEDEEPYLHLYSYIHEFIEICPEKYLENGIFGKFMRSVMGVIFFSKSAKNPDYKNIIRLSGFFAATYLFDDILDDTGYKTKEKEEYFQNVFAILNSKKSDKINYSPDPLMAFSESAFAGMRDILDERNGRIVSQSYIAIAGASAKGSRWNYKTQLTDKEIYSVAAIKAAYTRIIPAILTGHTIDEKFISHCMRAGLIYQLTDDLRDITDDITEGSITPFNYYCYGAAEQNIHPVEIFLAAVSRISAENLKDIPDAKDLWIMRITHSIRLLKLKYGESNLTKLLTEMNFPDGKITEELAMIAECSDVIVDLEAETAKICSDIAINMHGGDSKKAIFGH